MWSAHFKKSLASAFYLKSKLTRVEKNNPPAEKVIKWFKTWRNIKGLWLINPEDTRPTLIQKWSHFIWSHVKKNSLPPVKSVKQQLSVPE